MLPICPERMDPTIAALLSTYKPFQTALIVNSDKTRVEIPGGELLKHTCDIYRHRRFIARQIKYKMMCVK